MFVFFISVDIFFMGAESQRRRLRDTLIDDSDIETADSDVLSVNHQRK